MIHEPNAKQFYPSSDLMDDMIPPPEINFVGHGDFVAVGNEFLQDFVSIGGLQPHERVLDIGCGVGRMAIPLTQYLNAQGSYEGFDIVPLGIKWCQQKITPNYPNFRFQVADIFNSAYNPNGRNHGSAYRFPFSDRSFDFVFLTSVFTHLLPKETENYIAEIARVLKNDGRVFATFFLLNDESEKLVADGKGPFRFPHNFKMHRIDSLENEAGAVAYQQHAVQEMLARYGLFVESEHHGHWCGRTTRNFQDYVVSRKVTDVAVPWHLRWQRMRPKLNPRFWARRWFRNREQPDIDPQTKEWYLHKAS